MQMRQFQAIIQTIRVAFFSSAALEKVKTADDDYRLVCDHDFVVCDRVDCAADGSH